MHVKIGGFEIQFKGKTKQEAQYAAPSIIGSSLSPSGPVLNGYDRPLYNLLFIRETVAACMHARGEAMSRWKFHATENGRELARSHPLERLLASPNPVYDWSDMLELSSQWLDATGNSLFLKVRNLAGQVTELWPVPALTFQIERGADGLPDHYTFLPRGIKIPATDLIHVRRADIRTAPFLGHAILSDLLETAKADSAIRLFQERFFTNDATPRTVLKWPKGSLLTQDQMDDVRRRWNWVYQGAENAGKIGILPDGGDVAVLGGNARELDFTQSKKELRNAIREAFKVPQIVLGDVEGVNLSNAETSYHVFLRDVVDYGLAKHARALTRSLASEFGEGIVVTHEPPDGGLAPGLKNDKK